MMKARAKSFWNWDFQISGSSTGAISTTLDQKTENGTIAHAGQTYAVAKQKTGLGHWTLTLDAQTCGEAQITGIGVSKIEFTVPEGLLEATALPFSRRYDFSMLEKKVGMISPGHLLTRESIIDFDGAVGELTQVFCFWMAALKWYHGSQD